MKKTTLLNSNVSSVIAKMGHKDTLTIGDCGLPIPQGTERIDLALKKGVPSFLDTLDTVLTELCVERAILAEEIKTASPQMHTDIVSRLENIPIEYVSHEELKHQMQEARAVIRTGECTSFANIILVSGVTF